MSDLEKQLTQSNDVHTEITKWIGFLPGYKINDNIQAITFEFEGYHYSVTFEEFLAGTNRATKQSGELRNSLILKATDLKLLIPVVLKFNLKPDELDSKREAEITGQHRSKFYSEIIFPLQHFTGETQQGKFECIVLEKHNPVKELLKELTPDARGFTLSKKLNYFKRVVNLIIRIRKSGLSPYTDLKLDNLFYYVVNGEYYPVLGDFGVHQDPMFFSLSSDRFYGISNPEDIDSLLNEDGLTDNGIILQLLHLLRTLVNNQMNILNIYTLEHCQKLEEFEKTLVEEINKHENLKTT